MEGEMGIWQRHFEISSQSAVRKQEKDGARVL